MSLPHGHDLRRGRRSITGQAYLLTFVTHERRSHFDDWMLACACARALATRWGDARVLAWVLMPDHWHGLVELGTEDLPRAVGRARAEATRRCAAALGRPLRLWQHGFHDRALRRDEDVRVAARYIVANPLRAGLVDQIGQWPFWDAVWL